MLRVRRVAALEEWLAGRVESLVTDRFGADKSWGALPADPWASERPLEALNSVMYSDLCLEALGDPDRELELDLDCDVLLQKNLVVMPSFSPMHGMHRKAVVHHALIVCEKLSFCHERGVGL